MAKTSAMYEKKEQRTDDRTDLRSLSDQQLIEGCLDGNGKENRSAWNEFFRRFIPCIKEGIREQLKSCCRLDLCSQLENQDIEKASLIKVMPISMSKIRRLASEETLFVEPYQAEKNLQMFIVARDGPVKIVTIDGPIFRISSVSGSIVAWQP